MPRPIAGRVGRPVPDGSRSPVRIATVPPCRFLEPAPAAGTGFACQRWLERGDPAGAARTVRLRQNRSSNRHQGTGAPDQSGQTASSKRVGDIVRNSPAGALKQEHLDSTRQGQRRASQVATFERAESPASRAAIGSIANGKSGTSSRGPVDQPPVHSG